MARRRNELERLYRDGSGLPSTVEDNRARLMPETTINPEVGSKLVDLSVLDATRAFGKKIWRVVKLRELSAYNLETKKQSKAPNSKSIKLVRELAAEESEARKNLRTMADLEATLENFPAQIEGLQKTYKINKDRVAKLQQRLRNIRSAAANLAEQVSDFSKAERIPDLEADLAQQTGWRKALRGAHLVASKVLYDQASDDRYQKAYQSQAEIEEQIRGLEASIKREKGVDLTSSPVEDNLNAKTTYDPARLSYADFKARQERLVKRLKDCVEVPGEYQTGKEKLEQQKEEFAKKKKENKRAAKAVKAFEAGRRYKLERLLWHEFGDKIALIRGWQARLPKMSHLGQDAYMSHVTAINRHYEKLRADIAEFETDNGISGLVEILDYELGIKPPLRLNPVPPMPPVAPAPPGGGAGGPGPGAAAGGPAGPGPAGAPGAAGAPGGGLAGPGPAGGAAAGGPAGASALGAPWVGPAGAAPPASTQTLPPVSSTTVLPNPVPHTYSPIGSVVFATAVLPNPPPPPPAPALPAQLSPQRQELMRCVHDYLSYEDVYDQLSDTEKERLDKVRAMRERGVVKEMYEKYGNELLRIMQAPDKWTNLNNLANSLWQKTQDFLNKLGVSPDEISPWTKSKSWVYLDLAKQSYLLAHPEESNSNYRLADPLEDTQIRDEIVARMLGWEIRRLYSNSSKRDLFELMIDRTNDPESQFVKEFLSRSQTAPKHSWEYTRVGYFFKRIVFKMASGIVLPPQVPSAPPVVPPSASAAVEQIDPERQRQIQLINSYLLYQDVYDQLSDEDRDAIDKQRELVSQGNIPDDLVLLAKELDRIINDTNRKNMLGEIGREMLAQLNQDLLSLGVPESKISPETKSKTWVMINIAYWTGEAGDPDDPNYRAYDDPFVNEELRRFIVDVEIGQQILDLYADPVWRLKIEDFIKGCPDQDEANKCLNDFLLGIEQAPNDQINMLLSRWGMFFRINGPLHNPRKSLFTTSVVNAPLDRAAASVQPPSAPPVAPPSSPTPVIEVKAEVIELPLSDEQAKNTPLDEQKKIVQKNLTRIFGLDSTQSTIVWNILGDLETTHPDKFTKYLGLICLFSDALEFLFRLRYKDQPLQLPNKNLKALPAKPKDRQSMHGSKILDVLDNPNRLRVLAATLRSGKLQDAITGLSGVGELYGWFKSLKVN